MKKFLLTLLTMSALCGVSYGADIPITPTGPVFKLLPAPTWGISGPTGFNNNFFFTPLSQNESVCVFVKNNNTTNLHTFTASISINSDPANITPSDGTWQVGAFSTLFAAVSPGQPAGIGAYVSGAAQVSVNFSTSSTQAGSPETANVVVVQTTGNCFSGNQSIGSAPQTIASVTPLQAISDGLSQSYVDSSSLTNPTAGQLVIHVFEPVTVAKTLYFDKVIISVSAATEIQVNLNSTVGTACLVVSPFNIKNGGPGTFALGNNTCTVGPSIVGQLADLFMAANTSITIDLKGVIANTASSGVSVDVPVTLAAGTVTAQLYWYEK